MSPHPMHKSRFFTLFSIIILLSVSPVPTYSADNLLTPVEIYHQLENPEVFSVKPTLGTFQSLKNSSDTKSILLPLSDSKSVKLELSRFEVISPKAKFVIGSPSGDIAVSAPNVVLYRGKVAGDDNSYAYLSFTSQEHCAGYVSTGGVTYYMGHPPGADYSTITKDIGGFDLPPFVEMCGVDGQDFPDLTPLRQSFGPADSPAGPRLADIAFDADQKYYNIFGDLTEAQNYMVTLLGAVTDIYLRDVNMLLQVVYMRVWTTGGEPFNQNDLSSFADYWNNNEDTSGYDIIHLLTGRRDLGFGGVAYVASFCSDFRYSISGFVNGTFPTPVGIPNNSNWDIIVMAHEMGHNFGTLHTHDDQYEPLIDSCAQGFPSRGTIMSYCHIHPGYTSNIDMRFHSRVQLIIENTVVNGSECFVNDCNMNGEDDAIDILNAISPDVNSNGIPDECEDCNGNSILDPSEIIGGAPDVDGNGILDECQEDCNGNNIPDEFEAFYQTNDLNGNNVLDECDPDCNGNLIADFIEIADGSLDDFDRNNIPDICQDCNGNEIPDWLDLEREFNLYVADRNGGIREYHHASGYPIQTLVPGSIFYDVVIGVDRMLYATADQTNVLKINPNDGSSSVFWTAPASGIRALTFGPDGNLYVANYSTDEVYQIDGSDGSGLGVFITAGLGGLDGASALTFSSGGNLFVGGEGSNSVMEYSGVDGSYIGTLDTTGGGFLGTPRGLAFKPDGNLLVCDFSSSRVLEFDGLSKSYIGDFNDENLPENCWGITIAPTGNVFVVRSADQFYQVFELFIESGRYYRSFVRRDYGLDLPAGLAFMPVSSFDCNGNYVLDDCEGPIAECCCVGTRGDANGDGSATPNILDLNFLVNFIFRLSGNPGPCLEESNVNGDSSPTPNILDLNMLINYIFRQGPAPGACG